MRPKFWSLGGLVALVTAILAMSGMAASSASAACSLEILGQGSSLQKTAQLSVWIPDSALCVEYTASGSAAGLKAYGVGGLETPAGSKDAYVGTDDAPSAKQLEEMETAAHGKYLVAGETQDLVIPTAQSAIAVIVNPPAGCTISAITNSNLQKVWSGEILEWSGITGGKAKGAGVSEAVMGVSCKTKITRVVRQDGSGTTYQFKHYLYEINKAALECVTVGEKLWTDLQEEPTRNVEWPETCAEHTLSPVVDAEKQGGGGEAEEVLNEKNTSKEGSIGYAALADARAKYTDETGDHYHWLAIQNEGHTPEYEEPGTAATEPGLTAAESNCEETKYTSPLPALGADEDWSKIYGGNPTGNGHYPICTLTWDVALEAYETAGLTGAEGTLAKEYLEYVTSATKGQKDLAGHDYGPVEAAVGKYAAEEAALVKTRN